MKKLFLFGVASLSLALSLALVTSGAVVASSVHQIDPPEYVVMVSRLVVVGYEDDDGDGDGVDTPTPTDNDGTDSDGIDTPTPTDNDGTDSDGIDTPIPTDSDGKAFVSYTNTVVAPDISSSAVGATGRVSGTALEISNAPPEGGGASQIFDDDASYRVFTRYGDETEIDLANYLASDVEGVTFSFKSCDDSGGDYYDSAAVENGKLVLTSNALGHVHGPNTQSETVCTVTATSDGGSEDREFRLYTVSERTPPPMPSGALRLVESRSTEIDVQLTVPGGSRSKVAIRWQKPGGQPHFGVVYGFRDETLITIPGLETGIEYDVRAYWLSGQGFDLYRGTNSGSPGDLIVVGIPNEKWGRNLAGGGLGKSDGIAIGTPVDEDDYTDDDAIDSQYTDNDGTDSDGIDTPTPTDNDGTDSDGIDTPTPTDNDGTDSDGIDTPTPTDNDGTDSDGIDTPTPQSDTSGSDDSDENSGDDS